jgi:hypothetical protein
MFSMNRAQNWCDTATAGPILPSHSLLPNMEWAVLITFEFASASGHQDPFMPTSVVAPRATQINVVLVTSRAS